MSKVVQISLLDTNEDILLSECVTFMSLPIIFTYYILHNILSVGVLFLCKKHSTNFFSHKITHSAINWNPQLFGKYLSIIDYVILIYPLQMRLRMLFFYHFHLPLHLLLLLLRQLHLPLFPPLCAQIVNLCLQLFFILLLFLTKFLTEQREQRHH